MNKREFYEEDVEPIFDRRPHVLKILRSPDSSWKSGEASRGVVSKLDFERKMYKRTRCVKIVPKNSFRSKHLFIYQSLTNKSTPFSEEYEKKVTWRAVYIKFYK